MCQRYEAQDFEKILGKKVNNLRQLGSNSVVSRWFLQTSAGDFFAKSSSNIEIHDLQKEANGLKELAKASHEIVPNLIHESSSLIVMEYLPANGEDDYKDAASKLVKIHKINNELYGFDEDNYIGASRQINTPSSSWEEFFWTRRIEPQLKLMKDYSLIKPYRKKMEGLNHKLLKDITEAPSLLHGDLWSGNLIFSNNAAYYIDPAVYYGNRETDLAMTELFGGFTSIFYRHYNEFFPLESGYQQRKYWYNCYHLLNHHNLYGSGYLTQVIEISSKF